MDSKKERAKLGWCWWLFVSLFAGLVVAAAFLTLWKDFHFFRSRNSRDHGTVDKYVDALSIAMQFFEIQKCIYCNPLSLVPFILRLVCNVMCCYCSWKIGEKWN